MIRIVKIFLLTAVSLLFLFPASGSAMNRRKFQEQPPRLKDVQYRWCQNANEKQIQQRAKHGMTFNREVGKEEGKMNHGFRSGQWTFRDKDGKKMAEGKCQAEPPHRETQEHGQWSYWDTTGRKVELDWDHGKYNGIWTLYDSKGKKRWEYQVKDGQAKKEIFADEAYLTAENLRKDMPARTGDEHEGHDH